MEKSTAWRCKDIVKKLLKEKEIRIKKSKKKCKNLRCTNFIRSDKKNQFGVQMGALHYYANLFNLVVS